MSVVYSKVKRHLIQGLHDFQKGDLFYEKEKKSDQQKLNFNIQASYILEVIKASISATISSIVRSPLILVRISLDV